MDIEQWKKDKWKRKVIGFVAKLLGQTINIEGCCYGEIPDWSDDDRDII